MASPVEVLLSHLVKDITNLQEEVRAIKLRTIHAPLNAGPTVLTTINGGEITAVRPHISLIPQTGTADDLETINNGFDGKMIALSLADSGDVITIKHGTGNISLSNGVDFDLDDLGVTILLIYKETTSSWEQVGFADPPSGGVPAAHAPSHQHGGADEVATATPGANAIPKAEGSGLLANGWLDATLASIAALNPTTDESVYFTATNVAATYPLSAYGRTLAALANAAAGRTALELVAGAAGDIWVEKAGDTMSGALNMGSQLISNMATPLSANDAATKAYVDALAVGLDVKASVRAATTVNITLSAPQTVDGVAVIAGDRVLVKNQSVGADNGIYVVAAGAWTRATDADTSAEVTSGMFTFVTEGPGSNGDTGWALTTNDPITLGSTSLVFSQFSGPTNLASLISNASTDDTIADTDIWGYVTAAGILVKTLFSNLKAVLKTHFDTLYGLLATANTWVQNQTIASTQTTGNALRVVRDLASANTNAPVVDIVQDNAGDDQNALRVQQDGTGKLITLFDGALEVFEVRDGGILEAGGSATSTQGDIYLDPANKLTYIGRLSPTSGDNSGLVLQDRLGNAYFKFDPAVASQIELAVATGASVIIGTGTAAAKLHVIQPTLGSVVQRLQSTATNDDPTEDVIQGRVATADATVTTVATITIPASTTVFITATVVARRTGGVAGTAEDGAAFIDMAAVTNIAGTATLIGSVFDIFDRSNQASWDCTIDVTGATARVRVTGATNNNVTWHATVFVYPVGS